MKLNSNLAKLNIIRRLYDEYKHCVVLFFELCTLFTCEYSMYIFNIYITRPEGACYYDNEEHNQSAESTEVFAAHLCICVLLKTLTF
jgi:hypothetical protein